MRKILLILMLSLSAGAMPLTAGAHGCIKGAAVGGVVGHLAGHHAVAGAVVGCAVGHHRANMKEREAARGQAATQANTPGAPAHTEPRGQADQAT
jgi:hypothetical protein